MNKWRRQAFREVRDELDRFLNYPLNQQIKLGDFGLFDGKRCRFEWQGNLRDLGIDCASAGFQNEIAEFYSTAGVVSVQGRLALNNGNPAADVRFRKTSALAFRAYKIGFDQAQLVALSQSFNTAIQKGLAWDRSWVIITQLWRADGFTHLVSGGRAATIQIEATASDAKPGFNFADPHLGLQVVVEDSMSYSAVGLTEVKPYFAVHKVREIGPGKWGLYKYGLPK